MTLRGRKKVAATLRRIVKAEAPSADWSNTALARGLRQLAAHAERMRIVPEDVLDSTGHDALIVIARAIVFTRTALPALGAEWRLVVALAEPEFSIQERELFAS
jgi:hypothetical protein